VFFSNGKGDRLLSLPALRALVSLFGRRLTLVCDCGAASFFRSELELKAIVEITDNGTRREFDVGVATAAVEGCDLLLSLVPWSSDALDRLIKASAPRLSVGFGPSFDVPLARDFGKHSADLAFDLPLFLDPSLEIGAFAGPLQFDPGVDQRARHILAPLPRSVRVLTLHADTFQDKQWPAARMREVIDRFLARHPDFVVIVVGMDDCTFRDDRTRARVLECCRLPLDLTMQIVGLSDLFLGVDSCMLHAADLGRVPGVGLFGSTKSAEFGFRFGPHRHVDARSMDEIAVGDVVPALIEMSRISHRSGVPRRYVDASHGVSAGELVVTEAH
jgi:hypothetical protein